MSGSSATPPGQPDADPPGQARPVPGSLDRTFTAPPSGITTASAIGPYRILEKIGEGGMGEVYLADQTAPVRRQVALKLIKLGMDTKEVVARFESERQALALLNHPNIAHVFDAGVSPEGRPYFAMEFVKGVSIRTYCDTERLTIPERLRLFIQVCEGVQHAHQKGIIHRDLKPSNILVTMLDGKPAPKIIDFGIAKATSQQLTASTLHTIVGRLIGTPAYMSPEQADHTLLDIDTRTDVYSLGAVLYELLTGHLPLGHVVPGFTGVEEIVRTIREVEPIRPSTLVATTSASSAAARNCRLDVSSLARDLRGDLDWIAVKALEKDRTRRYDSVSEFAADLVRHLNHEPVLASPPSTPYRVRKFIRRHRVGVAAGTAVGLALIAGIVGTSLGLVRARAAERRARMEAETATEVTDFMVNLFHVSDPSEARGNTITAREVLDTGAKTIQQRLRDRPIVRARIMDAIGTVYVGLGLGRSAVPILREVLVLRERTLGPEAPEVATSLMKLAAAVARRENHPGEAVALDRRALAIRRKVLGPRHLDTAYSERGLGTNLFATLHENAEAKLHLERALDIFRSNPGKGDLGASWCLTDLAMVLTDEKQYEQALENCQEALRIKQRVLDPEDRDLVIGMNNVGWTLLFLGRFAEAKPLLQRSTEIAERTLGPNHPGLGMHLQSLGECLRLMGDNAAARDTLERAVKLSGEWVGSDQAVQGFLAHESLGALYTDIGQYGKAESNFQRAVEGFERGGDRMELAATLEKYAALRDRQRESGEAAKLRARAKEVRTSLPKP